MSHKCLQAIVYIVIISTTGLLQQAQGKFYKLGIVQGILIALLYFLLHKFIIGIKCPANIVIAPCSCTPGASSTAPVKLDCSGNDITQRAIDVLFLATRYVNCLSDGEYVEFPPYSSFYLWDTQMTTLDIQPLLNTSFEQISLANNWNLTQITGPELPHQASIKADKLFIRSTRITDDGFGDTLKYFDPSILTYLNLGNNRFAGSKQQCINCGNNFELLPGLSEFTKLNQLFLDHNPIVNLGDGPFASNNRLTYIDFNILPVDPIVEPNAFAFRPITSGDSIINRAISISFYANKFDDTTINMKENGLFYTQRPIFLDISYNKFVHFSQENFEPFLNAHDTNQMYVSNNPLICDERMKWLKDQRNKFESKVLNAYCSNDRGNTVFNSTLIP